MNEVLINDNLNEIGNCLPTAKNTKTKHLYLNLKTKPELN
jgi:hypothetical protein